MLVCEVMGRDAGWIAITSGIAGGADVILVPEVPIDIEEVCRLLKYRHDHGKKFGIVVAAEGALSFRRAAQATHGENGGLVWACSAERDWADSGRGD